MRYQDVDSVLVIEKDQYSHPWNEKLFSDCIATGYHCVVVEHEGVIAAYAILMNGYREGHILNICVARAWQGKGLGRVLLRYLFERASLLGADDMFLEVRPSNPVAIRLYESSGFNEVGRRPDYYNSDSGREDAIIMAAALAGFADDSSVIGALPITLSLP